MNTQGTVAPGGPGRVSSVPLVPAAGAMPGLPGVSYAFSDRADGTLSSSVGDGDAAANRARFLPRVDLSDDVTVFMRQVHGNTVQIVDSRPESPPEADALVTSASGLGLAVFVADCVPVLLATTDRVGVVHAGRAGVANGIVAKTVNTMSTAGIVHAIVGPAIGPCCYEVPADMATQLSESMPRIVATTSWDTPSLDLPGTVVDQLAEAGVGHISRVGECTRCAAETWFSHRASSSDQPEPAGRQAGVIVRVAP